MKPTAYITYKGHLLHADDPKVLEHSNPEPLYTQAQLLAVQQRTAEACAKDSVRWNFFVGYMLSDRTDFDDDFVACTTKAAINELVDEEIRNGELREYL